jgi:hypothetical protein
MLFVYTVFSYILSVRNLKRSCKCLEDSPATRKTGRKWQEGLLRVLPCQRKTWKSSRFGVRQDNHWGRKDEFYFCHTEVEKLEGIQILVGDKIHGSAEILTGGKVLEENNG